MAQEVWGKETLELLLQAPESAVRLNKNSMASLALLS